MKIEPVFVHWARFLFGLCHSKDFLMAAISCECLVGFYAHCLGPKKTPLMLPKVILFSTYPADVNHPAITLGINMHERFFPKQVRLAYSRLQPLFVFHDSQPVSLV